ncbi:Uncharacterized protein QJS10_CPA16g01363 [Acorus calamus]|uniref:Ribosomal protein L34e superfamily protein n=1 Tax=Acorus calamus TaxID=4465 RepID=A0AAV9D291_ACOCL|nr:Uncharacterized protein QJS10_CPA16g01363 [Acorus calamus]
MRLPLTTAMPPSAASSAGATTRPKKSSSSAPNNNLLRALSSISSCSRRHSPSAATLDILILLLVLFSCAFLVLSSLSHIARSLSALLPDHSAVFITPDDSLLLVVVVIVAPLAAAAGGYVCCLGRKGGRRRGVGGRCGRAGCKGLRGAGEFDLRLQTEECLKSMSAEAAQEIEGLPWKGGAEGKNPDYECLRAELRRMAPINGRAVLLFRAPCGCPVAKLEGWAPKRGRRNNKK